MCEIFDFSFNGKNWKESGLKTVVGLIVISLTCSMTSVFLASEMELGEMPMTVGAISTVVSGFVAGEGVVAETSETAADFKVPTQRVSKISAASSECPTSTKASVASCPATSDINSPPPLLYGMSAIAHILRRKSVTARPQSRHEQ